LQKPKEGSPTSSTSFLQTKFWMKRVAKKGENIEKEEISKQKRRKAVRKKSRKQSKVYCGSKEEKRREVGKERSQSE